MKTKIAVLALLAVSGTAGAAVSFTGTDGFGRSATAEFSVVAGNLRVVLTNDSTADVMVPVDVLTGVFFTYGGSPLALTPTSALLNTGSVVLFDSPPVGGNVGGEWAYAGGISGPSGHNYGISSAGLGIFGNGNFGGPDLDPPTAVNGLNYGITSAGDNTATGNSQVTGARPLIKNSVVFTLSGLGAGFDLNKITAASFQYGTDLGEPRIFVPAPGAMAIAGLGALSAMRRRRR